MRFWTAQYNAWAESMRTEFPLCTVPDLNFQQTSIDEASSVWKTLGDDYRLKEIVEFLKKAQVENSSSEPPVSLPVDWERKSRLLQEQCADRLFDSYRNLLTARLEELFPLSQWLVEFEKAGFLKQLKDKSYAWKPPLSTKGMDRFVEKLLGSFQARIHEVTQDCLSALFSRVERFRQEVLDALPALDKEGMNLVLQFFESNEKLMTRGLFQSLISPLKHALGKSLVATEGQYATKADLLTALKSIYGMPQWPDDAAQMLRRRHYVQGVLYATYLHLGFISEHELTLSMCWKQLLDGRTHTQQQFQNEVSISGGT